MKNNIFKYLGEKKFTLLERNSEKSLFASNEICILVENNNPFFEVFKSKDVFYITSGRKKYISNLQVNELVEKIKKL